MQASPARADDGPATATEAPPPPSVAKDSTAPAKVAVHFDANEEEVAFMLKRDGGSGEQGGYTYLCVAPCDTPLPKGAAHIGLSLLGGDVLDAKEAVVLEADATLRGTYRSRAAIRALGVGSIVGGAVLGSLIASTGGALIAQNGPLGWGFLIGGSALGLGGVVAGTVMLLKQDTATIELVPQLSSQPAVPDSSDRPEAARDRRGQTPVGEGLALRVRF
jgi:hypothetical protein